MFSELIKFRHCFLIIALVVASFLYLEPISAQSTEQLSPTPITSKTLAGKINARDIGDSRLTTYYFAFDGKRGDIFINVVTTNFNGDIDVFTVDGLKPRTKITVYADTSENETGRVVYMRKPERLLMRIQGRSPNDDPATYQIKFAGSFGALAASASNNGSELPTVDTSGEGTVRVNSVGTIIEDPEKEKESVDSETDVAKTVDTVKDDSKRAEKTVEKKVAKSDIPSVFDPRKKPDTVVREASGRSRPRVIINDPFADFDRKEVTVEIKKKAKPSAIVTIERAPDDEVEAENVTTEAERKVAALAKINLVITLKNGKKFQKRMSKVSSFNVFDGVLKVVGIDGKVTKFSILEVDKIIIE